MKKVDCDICKHRSEICLCDISENEESCPFSEIKSVDFLLNNPLFDSAVIGISTDNILIYDYDLMISALMKEENCNIDDAISNIEFNIIRLIDYLKFPPIIMYSDSDVLNFIR